MYVFKVLVFHEWKLLFREPKFLIPFLVPPLVLLGSQCVLSKRFSDIPLEIGQFILLLLGVMAAPMAAPFTADAFAGERERRTLELLQMAPLPSSSIFFAKLISVWPIPFIVVTLSQCAFAMHTGISLDNLLKALICTVSSSLFLNGFSLLISLHSKSVRAATQMSVVLSMPLFFLVQVCYDSYFKGFTLPVSILFASIVSLAFFAYISLRQFRKL